jgi:hypothetical protein
MEAFIDNVMSRRIDTLLEYMPILANFVACGVTGVLYGGRHCRRTVVAGHSYRPEALQWYRKWANYYNSYSRHH